MLQNHITLLHAKLLNDSGRLKTITHWSNVLDIVNGWSYDLEIIWILQQLESAGIKKGATILDAGGGLGVMQFILSSLGYNVISVDYAERTIPHKVKKIFKVKIDNKYHFDYHHSYMDTLSYSSGIPGNEQSMRQICILKLKTYIHKMASLSRWNLNRIMDFPSVCTQGLLKTIHWFSEVKNNHKDFGDIKFIRAAFHDIPIGDNKVDAIISLASLGHVDKHLVNASLVEFNRVLKPSSPLIITTCAIDTEEDMFYKKTQGWCFCLKSLQQIVPNCESIDFEYSSISNSIINSKILRSRVNRYYYNDPESAFYQKKYLVVPYLPVGVVICKNE